MKIPNKLNKLSLLICSLMSTNVALANDNVVPAPLPAPVVGITGVYPAANSTDVSHNITPEIFFNHPSHFGYTGGQIEIRDTVNGNVVLSFDPEPGDVQEGNQSLKLHIPEGILLHGHTYEITAGGLFARINGEPWNVSAIDSGSWIFTIAPDSAPETPIPVIDTQGVASLSPNPGSINVALNTIPTIHFTAPSHYRYTDSSVISIINLNTGETIQQFNPEPGDTQEGNTSYQLPVALEPDTSYEITAQHLFARLTSAPWNVGEIAAQSWQFSTGSAIPGEPPPTEPQPEDPLPPEVPGTWLPGINGLSPTPGATLVPLDTTPTIAFSATATYGHTSNAKISLVNINTGDIVAEFDPEAGDAQERNLSYQLAVTLEPDTDYAVIADHLFARVNAEPWNLGAIPQGYWQFSTDSAITSNPIYPAPANPPAPPPTEPTEPGSPTPGDGAAETDLTWAENIPQARPRLIFDQTAFAQAQAWYASNPFEPRSTTNPIYSSFDPVGNAFKYLLTGNTQYADIALAGVFNAAQAMHQQIGGHCDECRWYGEEVIIVYDWLYDYMSTEQRTQLKTMLDETFEYYLDFFWGAAQTKFAENNYFWGYFRNAALWGIANYHESDNAEMFLRRSMGERWDAIGLPHFNQHSPSGIPAEGTNYGPTMLYYNIGLQQTLKLYDKDLHNETNWYRNAAWWLMYTALPKPTYDNPLSTQAGWSWFPYGDANGFWNGNDFAKGGIKHFLSYATSQWNNTDLEKYLRTVINRSAMNDGVPELLRSFDDGSEELALDGLPTDYFIDGELAYAYTKNTWQDDATIVNLQLATPSPVGHEHLDSGSWQMWKDGIWASRESPARGFGSTNGQIPGFNGEGSVDVHRPIAHNVLLVDGDGPLFQQNARAHVQHVTSDEQYFYAAVDLTNAYAADKVDTVKRNFLFIKPLESLLILDEVKTKNAASQVSFIAHFQQAPVVAGNKYSVTNRHIRTELTTLLPTTGFSTRTVNEQRGHLDNAHRFVVESASAELMLHAIAAQNSTDTALQYQLTESDTQYVVTVSKAEAGSATLYIDKATNAIVSLSLTDASSQVENHTLAQGIEIMTITNDNISWSDSYQ